jgi:hypothetical protein
VTQAGTLVQDKTAKVQDLERSCAELKLELTTLKQDRKRESEDLITRLTEDIKSLTRANTALTYKVKE